MLTTYNLPLQSVKHYKYRGDIPVSLLAFRRAIDYKPALAAPPGSACLATLPTLMTELLCSLSMRPLQTLLHVNAALSTAVSILSDCSQSAHHVSSKQADLV